MGQVLYRKYRSKSLDEIVGQEHVTTTLKKALKSGAISHAYLFTGPRGVGKTSIARILAHELNQLPYTGEDMHLDIIEIDAASNRGIDEIRDLRDKVHISPTSGKYKVYIIDEVHMLTTPAFNALLKTLEEPPAHAVFILATTESHKLPETIISRTQRYNFRPVAQDKVVQHLKDIAAKEKIKIDDTALELIAAHGEGSIRDSFSLLNQAASHADHVTAATMQDILGLPPQTALQNLLDAVLSGDKRAIVSQLSELHNQGFQAATIAKQLAKLGRELILSGSASDNEVALLSMLASLLDIPTSNSPQHLLEIVLLKTAVSGNSAVTAESIPAASIKASTVTQPISTNKPKTPKHDAKNTQEHQPEAENDNSEPETTTSNNPAAAAAAPAATGALDIDTVWQDLLNAVKTQHNTVYGILRMAVPVVEDDKLILAFKYSFHQKRMSEPKHQAIIKDTLRDISGHTIVIECRYDKDVEMNRPTIADNHANTPPDLPLEDPQMATISNIFGGAELLES